MTVPSARITTWLGRFKDDDGQPASTDRFNELFAGRSALDVDAKAELASRFAPAERGDAPVVVVGNLLDVADQGPVRVGPPAVDEHLCVLSATEVHAPWRARDHRRRSVDLVASDRDRHAASRPAPRVPQNGQMPVQKRVERRCEHAPHDRVGDAQQHCGRTDAFDGGSTISGHVSHTMPSGRRDTSGVPRSARALEYVRRATTRPASQPGARPCGGGRMSSVSRSAAAINHAMRELEFHISPAFSSSRPQTGRGADSTSASSHHLTRPAQHAHLEVEDAARVAAGEQDRQERAHGPDDERDPEKHEHDEVRDQQDPLDQPPPRVTCARGASASGEGGGRN
jgi:hypothetical protein